MFTVNSDVVLDPGALDRLVVTAKAHPNSLVGSMVLTLNDPDDVWFFGASFDRRASDVRHVRGHPEDFPAVTEVEILTGMGMLVPVEAFERVGLFDAVVLPQYFADMDFALRARKAGFTLLVDPAARVYCDTGSSWFAAAQAQPTLSYPFRLLGSRRSPHSVTHRYRFYARHWPGQRHRAFAHHYAALVKNELLLGYLPRLVKAARSRLAR